MTDQNPPEADYDDTDSIPNPDALGLIPHFEAPAGEEHPTESAVRS